jgi:GTPase SAR1 family protein
MKTPQSNPAQAQRSPEDAHLMKLCVIGGGAVGKSTITVKFIHGHYTVDCMTLILL